MPVADDDYRKKKSKANLRGRGAPDPMDIIGLGGGGAAGSVAARAAAPVAKSVLSSAAKFVRGFFGSGASNATRGVVVNTARTGTTVARVPKRIGPGSGSSNLPAVRSLPATRTAVGRPAPNNAGKIAVAAGVAAGGTAGLVTQGMREARKGGSTSTNTSTSTSTTSSTAPKRKTLADFMAEGKAKGKKGKGVSNYGYTMYKDYLTSSRAGAKADTIRVTGSKPKEGA
jgi:hypothetical protein